MLIFIMFDMLRNEIPEEYNRIRNGRFYIAAVCCFMFRRILRRW